MQTQGCCINAPQKKKPFFTKKVLNGFVFSYTIKSRQKIYIKTRILFHNKRQTSIDAADEFTGKNLWGCYINKWQLLSKEQPITVNNAYNTTSEKYVCNHFEKTTAK